jgi:futalosine hydrolase
MHLIVATATGKEMSAVLQGLDTPDAVPVSPGEAVRCCLAGREATLLVTGVAPVNAALALGRLQGVLRGPTGVLNLGVAGSFDLAAAPLGAAVAATAEIWPEYGLALDSGVDPRGIGFAQGCLSDGREVWERLELDPGRAAQEMGLALPQQWAAGPALTVAGASGTPRRARELADRHGALTESMEGFALAWGAAGLAWPFLEVRTVSNRTGARPPGDWDLPGALSALDRAARALLAQTPGNCHLLNQGKSG